MSKRSSWEKRVKRAMRDGKVPSEQDWRKSRTLHRVLRKAPSWTKCVQILREWHGR